MIEHRSHGLLPTIALLSTALLLGCASDLSDEQQSTDIDPDTPSEPVIELPGPGGAAAMFRAHSAGYHQATINATGDDWVYIDLDTQTQVYPADPASSDTWDIAHRGVDIKLNGGASGTPPSGTEVRVFADKVDANSTYPWEAVEAAPPTTAVEYVTDAAPGSALASEPEYALSNYPQADTEPSAVDGSGDYGWYSYSGYIAGSQITPRANVAYIIRTLECRYISLRMTGYYDADGNGKQQQFDLTEVPGPACSSASGDVAELGKAVFSSTADGMQARIDASDEETWVYIDLNNALQVTPTDPANDNSWDIALKRTDIRMNGGSSGSLNVGLHDLLRGDWSATTATPADAEFHQDAADALAFVTYPEPEETGSAACGNINSDNGWYYYSGFCDEGNGEHAITPRDVVYVLRGREGLHWKLRMLSYYDENGSSAHPAFEFALIE